MQKYIFFSNNKSFCKKKMAESKKNSLYRRKGKKKR